MIGNDDWVKVIEHQIVSNTWRLKVQGGYIYRYTAGIQNTTAMVFVPNAEARTQEEGKFDD